MAYGLHYSGVYQSPMRDRYSYHVEIYTKGYEGKVLPLRFTGDGISVQYGVADDDEIQPIKSTALSLELLVMDGVDMSELFSLDPLKHSISVSQDTGEEMRVIFVGYLSTGSFSQPYKNPPYPLTLEANDGIAALQGFKYQLDSKTRYNDTPTLDELLQRLLSPIGRVSCQGLPKVTPTQDDEDTTLIIGIPSAAIYAAYDDVPTHYDVLLMILKQFSLQLILRGGVYFVRPLCSIASKSGAVPIFADDGSATGMSTEAVMSMLPPLASVHISRKDVDNGRTISTMLDPTRWSFLGVYGKTYSDGSEATRKTPHGVRLRALTPTQGGGNYTGVWLYTFDGYVRETSATVELAMKMYNLQSSVANVDIGFFLVTDSAYRDEWIRLLPYADVQLASGVQFLEGQNWVDKAGTVRWNRLALKAIALAAQSKDLNFFRSSPLDKLMETPVTQVMSGIPASTAKRRLVMMVTSSYPFSLEITEPVLTHTDAGDVEVESATEEDVILNAFGTGDLSISQEFLTGEEPPVASELAPYIFNVESSTPVTGYVVPSMSVDYARALAAQLRAMRSDVTIQLEGDLYTKQALTLSSVLKDRVGRYYYANSIKHDLRRGLYNVQLRELAPLRTREGISADKGAFESAVAFDAGYVYIYDKEVLMRNIITETLTTLMTIEGTATLYKGVMCATIVDKLSSSVHNLYAYDHNGNEVSAIADLAATLNIGAGQVRTALYDITTATWWVVYLSSGKLHTFILTQLGDVIAAKEETGADIVEAYALPHKVVWQASGSSSGAYRTLFYDLLKDTGLSPRVLEDNSRKYLDINETFIIESADNSVIVKDAAGGKELATIANSQFIAANNAIILARSTFGTNTYIIYDARKGVTKRQLLLGKSSLTLCSDTVVVVGINTIHYNRIE